MSKKANPVMIGSFVVGSLGLVVIGILVFGSGKFFSKLDRYVVYFSGSVNGLAVGAPVKLKGVHIGSVTDIQIQFDADNNKLLTPVFIEVEPNVVQPVGGSRKEYDIKNLIDLGLRARLTLRSIVTGQLYVEFDFLPDTPVRLIGCCNDDIPEIPALPSSTSEIENTITKVIDELKDFSIKELLTTLLSTLRKIEKLVSSPEIHASAKNMDNTLEGMNALVRHIDRKIDPLLMSLEATLKANRELMQKIDGQVNPLALSTEETLSTSREVLEQAKKTLIKIDEFADPNSPFHHDLSNALVEFSAASRSIRVLSDYLQRNPDALLYGKNRTGRQ